MSSSPSAPASPSEASPPPPPTPQSTFDKTLAVVQQAREKRAKFVQMLQKHRLGVFAGYELELFHMVYGKKKPVPADVMGAIKEEDLAEFVRYVLPSRLKDSPIREVPRRTPYTDLSENHPAVKLHFRPEQPSFFSCRGAFHTIFGPLDDMLAELGQKENEGALAIGAAPSATAAVLPAWVGKADLEVMGGGRLYDNEYEELVKVFEALWQHPHGGERARTALMPYVRDVHRQLFTRPKGVVDEQGRGHAAGQRKSSRADVWVRGGSGAFTVNGVSIAQYFDDPVARFHVCEPLRVVGALDAYDVEAKVEGGGITGKAGAVRLGLSRALAALQPSYEQPLDQAGMLDRDVRIVERKKPGQKKARKKFQWVKR